MMARFTFLSSLFGIALLGALATSILPACKSAPDPSPINPFELYDEDEDSLDWGLLDIPVKTHEDVPQKSATPERIPPRAQPAQQAASSWPLDNAEQKPSPLAPTYPLGKSIDGKADDWDLSRARRFSERQFVELGQEFWSGASDLSVQIATDSDEGYMYFWIDVTDDTVVPADPPSGVVSDAVVIWLQDPRLMSLLRDLPTSLKQSLAIQSETAILITPDGQIRRYEGHGEPLTDSVHAATSLKRNGYIVEAAISLEALHHVSTIPLDEVAFRIEILDGDEQARPGVKSVLSMLPKTDADAPRFAVQALAHGWNSQKQHVAIAPRRKALGLWEYKATGWHFNPVESNPVTNWQPLSDLSELQARMSEIKNLSGLCTPSRNTGHFLEAYQSRNGQHLVSLFICGTRLVNDQCPSSATSKLLWLHMTPDGQSWRVENSHDVFDKSLTQCPNHVADKHPFHDRFSLSPLPMQGTSLWGVGWRMTENSSSFQLSHYGVHFLSVNTGMQLSSGNIRTQRINAAISTRTLARSLIYFKDLDDTPGVDICEIERIETQSCRGIHRECRTSSRGHETKTHIKTWNPKKQRFQNYLLNKHPKCTATMDLDDVKAFQLLHLGDRLGLIASPKLLQSSR